jgi:MFS family permease
MKISPVTSSKFRNRVRDTFRALENRNYRLFFAGQGVSLIGTWMQRTTMGWFIYRITGSAFLLGVMGFLSQIPILFLNPFAGVIADRYNRRTILIFTQIAFSIQASILSIIVLTNLYKIWMLLALALFQGIIDSFDGPVRQSFVVDMVENKKYLTNVIALNSAMFNVARLIGPSVAGILIIKLSEGYCFTINAFSYIAVIISLLLMKIKPREIHADANKFLTRIREGWKYSFANPLIKHLLTNIAAFTLLGMSYTTLLPVFAKDILHGNSKTMGLLMSMAGVGALTGALYLASRKTLKGLISKMLIGACVVSVSLLIFSRSQVFGLSFALMFFIGIGMMMQMAVSNSLLQTIVDDDKRGRVMSLYTMALMGISPFGSFIVGTAASRFSSPRTLLVCAFLLFIWTIYSAVKMMKLRDLINSSIKNKMEKEETNPI